MHLGQKEMGIHSHLLLYIHVFYYECVCLLCAKNTEEDVRGMMEACCSLLYKYINIYLLG